MVILKKLAKVFLYFFIIFVSICKLFESGLIDFSYKDGLEEYKKGSYKRTIDFCDKSLRFMPRNPKVYYLKALAYYQMNDFDGALGTLDRLFIYDPTSKQAIELRDDIYRLKGIKIK